MKNKLAQEMIECLQVGKEVNITQTEQQCRCENGCTQSRCPLESAFDLNNFDQLIDQAWVMGYKH